MTTNEARAAKRPARKPIGDEGPLANIPSLPGFYTRLVTIDDPSKPMRRMQFEGAYYEPVTFRELYGSNHPTPDQEAIFHVGKGLHGLLMKLPIEYREEDTRRKESKNRLATEAKLTVPKRDDAGNELYGSVSVSAEVGNKQT